LIKIESLQVSHFRGIKDLKLNLGKSRFGVFGPNGTGKSGVVDAIEFVLTGSITRLTGAGTDELSISKHGPHVDAGAGSDKAVVRAEGILTSTGKKFAIERSVAKPSKPKINPDDEETKATISEIERHPEFALSRREIVKYIITAPGKRDEDVKALLRLDRLDAIRKSLTTVMNSAASASRSADSTAKTAQHHFAEGLGIPNTKAQTILAVVNKHRAILQLPAIAELSTETNFKNGMTDGGVSKPALPKTVALKETHSLLNGLQDESADQSTARNDAMDALNQLQADAKAWRAVRQAALIQSGLPLIDENGCPLCDKPWEEQELRDYLEGKLASAKAAKKVLSGIATKILAVRQQIELRRIALATAVGYCEPLTQPAAKDQLNAEISRLKSIDEKLEQATKSDHTLITALSAIAKPWAIVDEESLSAVMTIKAELEKLPDVSDADKAEEQLILAQERYEKWVEAVALSRIAAARVKTAQDAKETFEETCIKELNQIYEAVQNDFASYYKQLNKGDEEGFEGTLTPGPAKLNLDVDFYGRGKFPPGAFHSEGHQDGMGLCLYLALMKQTMGDDFRFCVLDDVLMSVDAGHRRQVCHLLLKEFPDTQFVLTTHDRVWLNFMRAEKLISQAVTFGGWSVDTGPLVYDDLDMMERVRTSLGEGDIQTAAGRLRHYLEHIGYLLSDGLRAAVPFHADGQYTLNDTLPPALAAIKKRMKEAKVAANSWGKPDIEQSIIANLSLFENAMAQSKVSEWGVNPAVHFNAWQNFEPKEFEVIVDAFDAILTTIRCDVCGSLLRLSYSGPTPQALNCLCGDLRFDLSKKKEKSP
jgi:recombinational DNA repair ATPase RecF